MYQYSQYELTSIHPLWESTESHDRAINLTPRLSNSGTISETFPSSVVHTGV